MSDKYSSFKKQQILTEAWRKYAESGQVDEGFIDSVKSALGLKPRDTTRGKRMDSALSDPENTTDVNTDPDPGPTPEPPPPSTQTDDLLSMPISGTELATMNFLVNGQLLNIIRRSISTGTGAAANDPASKNLLQLFNKAFFPALIKMTKNPSVDIAEGIDMEQFLLEILTEVEGKMSRRQQAAMKGKLRARGGMKNYLKPNGSKPPILVNNIVSTLEQALAQNISADSLLNAAAEVSSKIKDPNEKKQYEDMYIKSLEKNPQKRIENYKQNVAAFISSVGKLATKAAETALSSGANFDADKASSRAQSRATGNVTSENIDKKWKVSKKGKITQVYNEKK